MKKFLALFCGCLVLALAMPATAQIDWNENPAEWDAIKAEKGKVSKGAVDLDDDDWRGGIAGFKGPVGSAGDPTMPISPGVILDNVNFDTVAGSTYATNLVGIGAGAFGNPSNMLAANYFVDAFEINLTEPNHSMVMLNLISLIGSYSVDVTFYDVNDQLIGDVRGVSAPVAGNPVLFWTQGRESIGRITIFDAGGGAEGVMQTEYWIPEPASLALLALGGLALVRRRR